MVSPHEHDGIVELVAIERIWGRDAFTPADTEVAGDLYQQDFLGVLRGE
jgi:hypothetical protein